MVEWGWWWSEESEREEKKRRNTKKHEETRRNTIESRAEEGDGVQNIHQRKCRNLKFECAREDGDGGVGIGGKLEMKERRWGRADRGVGKYGEGKYEKGTEESEESKERRKERTRGKKRSKETKGKNETQRNAKDRKKTNARKIQRPIFNQTIQQRPPRSASASDPA